MKLLVDETGAREELSLVESALPSGSKAMFIEGPFVMCNQVNRNGRNYDRERVGIPSVSTYQRDYIDDRRAIGELKHPDYPFPDIEQAVIKVESLSWQGNNAIGKARVLNTQKGQIIRALAEADFNLAVSTRGLGDVREVAGRTEVLPGFMLTAVDVVDRPSGQVCYVKAMTESVEWALNESTGLWEPRDVRGKHVDQLLENAEDEFIRRFKLALNKMG